MGKLQKQVISLLILLLISFTLFLANDAFAATGRDTAVNMTKLINSFALPGGGTNPGAKVEVVAGKIIGVFLSIFGVVFFALMVYGGYKWMIAQGREEEVKKAKDIIRGAIIGLIIIFAAYAITLFIVNRLSTAAGITGS